MANNTFDSVYGSIIGGAVGDALGAPVEMWLSPQIRERFGKVHEFVDTETIQSRGRRPAEVTDDTTLSLYITLAIFRKGGRISPDDLAEIWLEIGDNWQLWINEKVVLIKLQRGLNPWETGRNVIPAGCATMAIGPIGIVNAGSPTQAYQDGYVLAGINQDGLEREAAGTLAAGVASAFLPDATVQSVLSDMTTHSSFLVRRAIHRCMTIAKQSSSIDDFVSTYYDKLLDWTSPNSRWDSDPTAGSTSSVEILPVTMAILYLCGDDVNQALIEGASFGRDCDTIARAVGSIAGALHGASALRRDWIEAVERGNRRLFEEVEGNANGSFESIATRFVDVLHRERENARTRVAYFDALLPG